MGRQSAFLPLLCIGLLFHKVFEHLSCLGAGSSACRVENAVAFALHDSLSYSPAHGIQCPGADLIGIKESYFRIFRRLSRIPPEHGGKLLAGDRILRGSDGLITLPYFSGERTPINDPNATGMMFGLTLNHTRAHMYRSALEGVGYGIAQHFDIIRAMGQEPKNVYAVGGGTKSLSWMQLITDIANVPQIIREVTIGASFGDTLLAALAVGRYKNTVELKKLLTPAAESMRMILSVVSPLPILMALPS